MVFTVEAEEDKMSPSRLKITILLVSFFLLSQVASSQRGGAITTSGTLSHDEVWSGEVHLTGDILIPEGVTLVIRPGTIISFTPDSSDNDVEVPVLGELWINKCNLIVKGNLRMEGEKDNRIIMGKLRDDSDRETAITWGGIIFGGTNASSIIEYSEIRHADVAVLCVGSSMPRIVNSVITNNDVGIMTFDLSSPRVTSNRIHNSTLWSISCYDYSFPMISYNIIESSEVGIGCEDFSSPIIEYNTFSNNSVDILIQDDSNPTKLGNIF